MEIARNILKNDKKIKIIKLSRNFGQHAAINAGIDLLLICHDLSKVTQIQNSLIMGIETGKIPTKRIDRSFEKILKAKQILPSLAERKINLNQILKENKKKSMFLPVSAPFHSSLMKSAADKMREKIQNTSFQDPSIELVANVTAESVKTTKDIKNLLVDQINSKERWRESILNMIKNRVNEFI